MTTITRFYNNNNNNNDKDKINYRFFQGTHPN